MGLRLEPAAGTVRSRLGGPPLLPPGEPWPHAAGERPLTFLAGIDLAELPPHDPLPDRGFLLFFADLDPHGGEGLVDVATNEPGAAGRMFYVPPELAPIEAEPPADDELTLRARMVASAARLTLPDDYEVADRLGLDPAESEAYDEVATWLRHGDDWSPESTDHWMLGAWTGVQGHPVGEESVLLLQMANKASLDFGFLDAGAIQFRLPRAALEAGDWSAVVADADSC